VPAWYDLPRPGTHLVVHFNPTHQPRSKRDAVDLPVHLPLGDQRGQAEVRLMRIIHMHARGSRRRLAAAGASTALQSLLLWLAMWVDDSPAAGGATADRAVESAAALIDRRLSRKLSVPALAAQVNLSQNYLARRFRERFGMTMQQYQIARRVELARELLMGTDLPIKTVGRRVGLPDPQHFNKVFRNAIGRSPSQVRRGP